ncbi:uncharacterized protein BO95DRAFT_462124 [Aspergillus brunneoviolaceus CBS 621.78]|uniref:Uncharacterized protein n=1 Tax=Aspergillus brunneoviolaceus CBS 621.78 TaxID=1450534 RepID=A0ACD1GE75_9EURO|nr:hypothetical protein BO95DRAFT_462124 [Aspergillus brunneoviolaceus CBS 621.78]RAH47419.1 hypothetical protein BO95DRAFT_462124 [Aspergillus brunneoviolaceus CBS 621.78]
MKLLLLPLLALQATAWSLTIYFTDGGHITSTGRLNSGCKAYDLPVHNRQVNRVSFSESTFADTFELFSDKDCRNRVFREGKGSHRVQPPRRVGSVWMGYGVGIGEAFVRFCCIRAIL